MKTEQTINFHCINYCFLIGGKKAQQIWRQLYQFRTFCPVLSVAKLSIRSKRWTSSVHVLTQVQGVSMGAMGEGGALVHLIQQLLFHLCDGVTVQHFEGQWLGLIHSSPLHQHVQSLQKKKKRVD